jgi:hypothetical protein
MLYARIDLSKTNYEIVLDFSYLNAHGYTDKHDVPILNNIYLEYCRHKKFKSVMPIFDSEYHDPNNDIISYSYKNKIIAFSLIRKHDIDNVEAVQFAWDYKNPKLRLGIRSLENECAIYKAKGFKYYYLGEAAEYKNIDGYELLGPV